MNKKIITNIALTAVLILGLASCSNDDQLSRNILPEDNIIRVNANVNNSLTKAGIDDTNISEFGIFVKNDDSGYYSYDDIKVSKQADNSWLTSEQMLWKSATDIVTIYAYAPYVDNITLSGSIAVNVKADQSVSDSIKLSDFLYSAADLAPSVSDNTKTIYYDTTNKEINVTLNHRLAKLIVKITLGTEFNINSGTIDNPISQISINGTNIKSTFSLSKDTLTDISQVNSIITYEDSYNAPSGDITRASAQYECILIPQEITENTLSIKIKVGEKQYVWTSASSINLEAGKQYSLSLNVGKDVTVINDISTSQWIDNGAAKEIGTL